MDRLDHNQRAQFAGLVAGQWLGVRLQMMGVAMVTAVAFIGVLEHRFHTVNPGKGKQISKPGPAYYPFSVLKICCTRRSNSELMFTAFSLFFKTPARVKRELSQK